MKTVLVGGSLVVLLVAILASAFLTGHALAGTADTQAREVILLRYYRISFTAAFCMIVPSLFLFDSSLKRGKQVTP